MIFTVHMGVMQNIYPCWESNPVSANYVAEEHLPTPLY